MKDLSANIIPYLNLCTMIFDELKIVNKILSRNDNYNSTLMMHMSRKFYQNLINYKQGKILKDC